MRPLPWYWMWLWCFGLASLGTGAAEEARCRVTVSLTDTESGDVQPGLVRVARGDAYLPLGELQDRCAGLRGEAGKRGWHVVLEKTAIDLPAVDGLKVEAFSGLETKLAGVELDLGGKKEAELVIPLQRIFSASELGWVAGNTHLHLRNLTREQSDRYLREIPVVDGLSVVFVSHLERAIVDRTYISNEYTRDDFENSLSSPALAFGNGEEHRHNFGGGGEGFGHVMLLDLQELVRPVSIGPGISQKGGDSPPLRRGIEAARAQDATVIWCHNGFGLEDLPNWIAGRIDAQNIFDGGSQGNYEDTFYRYLNIGMEVPFSTGTDWFMYDFSRVYVWLPKGEALSARSWLEGLRAGRGIITNGPWLDFEVNGVGPGVMKFPGEQRIDGRAVGRENFGRLQLIRNGRVVAEAEARNAGGHFEAEIEKSLVMEEPGWLALRIAPKAGVINAMGKPLFAHTSPVYVSPEDGRRRFEPEVARTMIAEMEAASESIQEQGEFASEAEREVVRAVYSEGIEILEGRLEEHLRRSAAE